MRAILSAAAVLIAVGSSIPSLASGEASLGRSAALERPDGSHRLREGSRYPLPPISDIEVRVGGRRAAQRFTRYGIRFVRRGRVIARYRRSDRTVSAMRGRVRPVVYWWEG